MLEGTLSAPIGQSRVWLLVPISIDVLRVQCQYQRCRWVRDTEVRCSGVSFLDRYSLRM